MQQARNLQQRIVSGGFSYGGATLLMLGAWSLSYLRSPQTSYLLGGLGCLVVGLLLNWLNKTFALIRERTQAPYSLYILLGACCPFLHQFSEGLLAAVFLVFALHFLMRSFQEEFSQPYVFQSFCMLGIGGLIYPKLCFLFPIFLIGTIQFLSLNARSFVAALMGGLMPFWFLLAYGLVMRDIDLIVSPFLSLATFQPLGIGYELWQLPLYVLLLILFIVSTTHIYLTTYDERMRTRVFLRFLILLGGFLLLCMPLQPQEAIHLFPLASVPISLIAAHFFALTESRLSLAFTIFTLIALVGTYLFCLWML
ncbi:MAG: hypothetical protein IJ845_05255 [Bacteroidaceae bacterium]|nr:hypothetical protein [Bacteroidaceae bacterium]